MRVIVSMEYNGSFFGYTQLMWPVQLPFKLSWLKLPETEMFSLTVEAAQFRKDRVVVMLRIQRHTCVQQTCSQRLYHRILHLIKQSRKWGCGGQDGGWTHMYILFLLKPCPTFKTLGPAPLWFSLHTTLKELYTIITFKEFPFRGNHVYDCNQMVWRIVFLSHYF